MHDIYLFIIYRTIQCCSHLHNSQPNVTVTTELTADPIVNDAS